MSIVVSGEMRRGNIAVSGRRIAVHFEPAALIFDGAHGRVDLQRPVEAGIVHAGQIAEEVSRPRAAIAAIYRQFSVYAERHIDWHSHERVLAAKFIELLIVLDAFQAIGFAALVLTNERLPRTLERGQ